MAPRSRITPVPAAATVSPDGFNAIIASVSAAFVERSHVARHLVAALLGRHHVWLYGPPGVAKSALINFTMKHVKGAKLFTRQMSARTTEERVFGPWKLSALKQDLYERKVDNYAPMAHVVFLDEGGRSDRALRDALLTLMNERVFENGDAALLPSPLISMFSGSNSQLTDKEDAAFVDRFLVSVFVEDIRDPDNFAGMIFGQPAGTGPMTFRAPAVPGPGVTLDELVKAQAAVAAMPFAPEWHDAIKTLRESLAQAGITVSPRRWRESIGALRAFAWLEGAGFVGVEHGEYLADMLWERLDDRRTVERILGEQLNPALATATALWDELQTVIRSVPPDTDAGFLTASASANRKLREGQDNLDRLIAGMDPARAVRVIGIRDHVAAARASMLQRSRARLGA